ncbi:MAG: hypothetical protein ACP5TL_01655 [Candidatus Micrarchaeia archaeon]
MNKLLVAHLLIGAAFSLIVLSFFGITMFVLALAMSMPISIFSAFLEYLIDKRKAAELERAKLASAIKLIYINIRFGKRSFVSSVKKLSNFSNDVRINNLLTELHDRIALGQKLREALASIKLDHAVTKDLDAISEISSLDLYTDNSIRTLFEKLRYEHKYTASKNAGALQKYLTVSMLLSSVIPSFVLFSFVGYTLLMPSELSSFALMFTMLIAIPSAYSITRAQAERFYE